MQFVVALLNALTVPRIPPRAEAMDVPNRWHMCYHGTGVDSVGPILQCGGLMIRGEGDRHGFDRKHLLSQGWAETLLARVVIELFQLENSSNKFNTRLHLVL